jgi:hypothetical protein
VSNDRCDKNKLLGSDIKENTAWQGAELWGNLDISQVVLKWAKDNLKK